MRGTPGVVVVAPRIRARLDSDEPIAPLAVCQDAPAAREVGIERRIVRVVPVPVASGRVGLPDLDQGLRDGAAVLVQHATGDDDALTQRLAGMLAREIIVVWPDVVIIEYGSRDLGERMRQEDQR